MDVVGEETESAVSKHTTASSTPMSTDASTVAYTGTAAPTHKSPLPSVEAAETEGPRKPSLIEKQMFTTKTRSFEIPHLLFTHRIDLTQLNAQRRELQEQSGVRVSLLAVLTKAISEMMLQHPRLNSHLDTQDPTEPLSRIKKSHDFGFAVDTDKGLVVPVVRDVHKHTVQSLTEAIGHLSQLARDERLVPNDLRGASFVVSNIGSFGGDVVAPIIVAPMVAIVGLGRSHIIDGREEMTISWSADHRIIDGASVAKAARTLDDIVTNPTSLLTP